MVDEAKRQGGHLGCKDHHDDQEELETHRRVHVRHFGMFKSERNGDKKKQKNAKSHHAEAHFGLSNCGAATQHAEEKQDGADAEDDGGRNQRVFVLDEALEVIVAVDHVGSHVGQRASCSL